jgi:hypothetical protein
VRAAWRRRGSALALSVEGPATATYTAGVPLRPGLVVRRDGAVVWRDGAAQAPGVEAAGGYVRVTGITGATRLDADTQEGNR